MMSIIATKYIVMSFYLKILINILKDVTHCILFNYDAYLNLLLNNLHSNRIWGFYTTMWNQFSSFIPWQ